MHAKQSYSYSCNSLLAHPGGGGGVERKEPGYVGECSVHLISLIYTYIIMCTSMQVMLVSPLLIVHAAADMHLPAL
jgi:hypothetical protein